MNNFIKGWGLVLSEILNPEKWLSVINKPDAFGQMLGGLIQGTITGILAVCAGGYTFYTFNRERKKHHQDEFLQWLTELNNLYQQNTNYSEVRLRLAKDRAVIRRMLCCELLSDKLIQPSDILKGDKKAIEACESDYDKNLDWTFLRIFTDYLYFFEQILAFGSSLKEGSSNDKSSELVNHFGWFLRSLCFAWSSDDDTDKAKAASLFIKYLSYNRYQRLTEVSLCFLYDHCYQELSSEKVKEELRTCFNESFSDSIKIFNNKHHSINFPSDFPGLKKKWSGLVGFVGVIQH